MGISIYKIRKWYKMLTGQSISHVNQGVGKCYSKTEVAGYYNDLTEKVTKDDPSILVPQYYVDTGEKIFFSIGVFQYGLAAYDLYLQTNDDRYLNKLIACADWAVENQQEHGGWITFAYQNPKQPYSAMAQGEAISMLIRAYRVSGKKEYLSATHKAKDFMLKPISDGGTAEYSGDDVYLYECTYAPLILNGWIFALWGLYDYCKYFNDEKTQMLLQATLASLQRSLSDFDLKYWSKYDAKQRICSLFYHRLQIAQLQVMYDLFGDTTYKLYADQWELHLNSCWKPKIAFLIKAIQKLCE